MNDKAKGRHVDFDVAIVGGGMVGATLACALGDSGLRIALLDGNRFDAASIPCADGAARFDTRVSAIAPLSRQLLERVGAWEGIASARLCPYTDMRVWDAQGTGSIHFSAADIHASELGFIIENSIVLRGIYQRLERLAAVQLVAPARVTAIQRLDSEDGDGMRLVTEDGQACTATLLIGADGPLSPIRQLAGFRTREWDYRHQAIVTTVRTALPHRATALQRFMATGPLAFLPLPEPDAESGGGQKHCSIVWSVVPDRGEELLAMDDRDFARALGEGIEHRLGKIEWVDKRQSFPLRQRHAVDYVQPGIALVGDAAHTIHPLAGQGVNLGLQDVRVLAEEILSALERERPLAELALLRRYQRRRKGQNLGMMWLMEGFKTLFAQDALALRWLRNSGMSGVDRVAPLKNRLMRQAMGVG